VDFSYTLRQLVSMVTTVLWKVKVIVTYRKSTCLTVQQSDKKKGKLVLHLGFGSYVHWLAFTQHCCRRLATFTTLSHPFTAAQCTVLKKVESPSTCNVAGDSRPSRLSPPIHGSTMNSTKKTGKSQHIFLCHQSEPRLHLSVCQLMYRHCMCPALCLVHYWRVFEEK
jgi:hypothetical protein